MRSLFSLLALAVLLVRQPGEGLPQQPPPPLEKRVYQEASGKTLPYRLLAPAKLEPGRQYPLVLFLHGAGERGTDNERQLVHGVAAFASAEARRQYPCYLVAPQCPAGARWVEVDWGAEAHRQPAAPSEPLRLTLALLEALAKELPLDRRRVYVTGLSMGGFGTWDILSRRPELFAAAVPICGGGDEATVERIAKIPVWVFHGATDGVVRPSRSRNMVAALRKAGGEPKYTEYPKEGHASWGPAYRDPELLRWLFAQRRP
jgi:predicted peptidase